MSSTVDIDFHFQLAVWGHAYTGDACDRVAIYAESRPDSWSPYVRMWDLTAADLTGSAVFRDGEWRPAPEWWALPHVAEQVRGIER